MHRPTILWQFESGGDHDVGIGEFTFGIAAQHEWEALRLDGEYDEIQGSDLREM
ncbi:hypothetical protein J6524_10150 [Bradyrhizobium sp. WSM 1738]|uniref:hypothetical protein n=1 Tax=Bradyrhizobium hereditatis TaxID=2821405 RepID=UPI001CE259FE|nr:hypothetical protein [Bradyrhizobium hereditatis]MCA6115255.1 hypothetical protein [Bradyrhizobium hereditatis]